MMDIEEAAFRMKLRQETSRRHLIITVIGFTVLLVGSAASTALDRQTWVGFFVGGMICWGLGRSAWASTEVRHHDQMVAFLATRLPQLAEAGDLEEPQDLP